MYFLRRRDIGSCVKSIVEFKGCFDRLGFLLVAHQYHVWCLYALRPTHLSELQKPNCIKSLLNIRYLLSQSGHPPLQVRLHELVFPRCEVRLPHLFLL
jgi:hypothetical protein